MTTGKKYSYEKPMSLDAGQVASIMGAACSTGTGAGLGECIIGNEPTTEPSCNSTGATTSGNCISSGQVAAYACAGGDSPGCYSGAGF